MLRVAFPHVSAEALVSIHGGASSLHTLPIPAKIYITPGKAILYSVLDLNGWKHPQAMALSTLGRFW